MGVRGLLWAGVRGLGRAHGRWAARVEVARGLGRTRAWFGPRRLAGRERVRWVRVVDGFKPKLRFRS